MHPSPATTPNLAASRLCDVLAALAGFDPRHALNLYRPARSR
jgi:hypothetical protein